MRARGFRGLAKFLLKNFGFLPVGAFVGLENERPAAAPRAPFELFNHPARGVEILVLFSGTRAPEIARVRSGVVLFGRAHEIDHR